MVGLGVDVPVSEAGVAAILPWRRRRRGERRGGDG